MNEYALITCLIEDILMVLKDESKSKEQTKENILSYLQIYNKLISMHLLEESPNGN